LKTNNGTIMRQWDNDTIPFASISAKSDGMKSYTFNGWESFP